MQRRLNIKKTNITSYEPEYQAVLDYAGSQGFTLPSSAQNIINNNKVKWTKDLGLSITDDFDLIYAPKQEAGLSDFCRINWADPDNFYLTQSNGALVPDFVAGSGFKKENGDGFYFKTGFIPSVHGSAISDPTDTGLMIGLFNMESTYTTVSRIFGGRDGSNNSQIFISRNGQDDYLLRLYFPNSDTFPELDFSSATIYLDNDGTRFNRYVDGAFAFDTTIFASGQSTEELYFLAQNNIGALLDGGQAGISFLTLGKSIKAHQNEVYEIFNETYTP